MAMRRQEQSRQRRFSITMLDMAGPARSVKLNDPKV